MNGNPRNVTPTRTTFLPGKSLAEVLELIRASATLGPAAKADLEARAVAMFGNNGKH